MFSKKKGLQKIFFRQSPKKSLQKNFNHSKNSEDRAIFEDLRLRGGGQELDLRDQGRPRGLHL